MKNEIKPLICYIHFEDKELFEIYFTEFISVEQYPDKTKVLKNEIGSLRNFRICILPQITNNT